MAGIEIYLSDLVPEKKEEVLAAYGIELEEGESLDTYPIATIVKPDEPEVCTMSCSGCISEMAGDCRLISRMGTRVDDEPNPVAIKIHRRIREQREKPLLAN